MESPDPRGAELRLQPDPTRYTLPRFLEDVVERHAARAAVRFEGAELSYGELERESRRLARALIAAGVVKGARVALLMANRPEWIVTAFAVAMTGAVLVPVNTFATPDERDYILRHSDASVLLLQSSLLGHRFLDDLLSAHPELGDGEPGRLRCAALPQLRRVVCLPTGDDRADDPPAGGIDGREQLLAGRASVDDALLDAIGEQVTPADDAVIIYTSGTTARPKGVLHYQRAPVIQGWRFAELMGLDTDDRVWTAQPFFWTAGMAMSLGATMAAGACLVLHETFDAAAALACIEAERITTVLAWPHQEKSMAEHPDAAGRDLGSVKHVEFASPLAALAGLETDEWGTYGSYGLSETFTLASALPASAPAKLRADTSGKPLPGMQLRVVDPDSGQPIDEHDKGELTVKGLTFMRGYYKVEPELYLDGDGFFHTQDGGSFDDDGHLHWSGRLSNLIKTGGANVSPLEIEDALVEYPGLKAGVAVGVPHPTLGEIVVLCAVCVDEATPEAGAIREHLRTRLAAYKVPKVVLFFEEGDVSYTGNQKVQVAPLREAARARLAEQHVEVDGHRYGAEAS